MMSCFEIHIETVRDLLDPTNEIAQIMTNQNKFKLHEIEVTQFSDVDFVLNRAKENRKTAKTAMNEKSSRSHSIFQLKITGLKADGKTELNGALNLIDLAGSEKMSSSSGDLERQKEATAINKSLSSLGDVIAAIIRGDSYIPFRNSKLTHML
jgi:kinesin family member C1